MTATLTGQSADWLSAEDVARLTGRDDIGLALELGYLRSVEVAPWVFKIKREWVAEFTARYGERRWTL